MEQGGGGDQELLETWGLRPVIKHRGTVLSCLRFIDVCMVQLYARKCRHGLSLSLPILPEIRDPNPRTPNLKPSRHRQSYTASVGIGLRQAPRTASGVAIATAVLSYPRLGASRRGASVRTSSTAARYPKVNFL
jgi:hypothetical protein